MRVVGLEEPFPHASSVQGWLRYGCYVMLHGHRITQALRTSRISPIIPSCTDHPVFNIFNLTRADQFHSQLVPAQLQPKS